MMLLSDMITQRHIALSRIVNYIRVRVETLIDTRITGISRVLLLIKTLLLNERILLLLLMVIHVIHVVVCVEWICVDCFSGS